MHQPRCGWPAAPARSKGTVTRATPRGGLDPVDVRLWRAKPRGESEAYVSLVGVVPGEFSAYVRRQDKRSHTAAVIGACHTSIAMSASDLWRRLEKYS